MMLIRTLTLIVGLSIVACTTGGCARMYYSAMETVGTHKRDILTSRVEKARDEQHEAKEQFLTTYEQFKALTGFDGGDLEREYNRLQDSYDECEDRAEAVSERIDSIEEVGNALFREWNAELDEYRDAKLRAQSERQMKATQKRFDDLLIALRSVESRMDPVLGAFHDQVLFLKHNLNAQAVASLQGTVGELEADVSRLIRDMESSISEADAFLGEMREPTAG